MKPKNFEDKSIILRQGLITEDSGTVLTIAQGDITEDPSSAIVCPANNFLDFHGGVAAKIIQKGGQCIMEEAEDIIDEIVMLPTGGVEHTLAGKLPCKYIIHAVGPNMNDPS